MGLKISHIKLFALLWSANKYSCCSDLITVIITPAPVNTGYVVNGVTAQAVVLPSTSTTVQVTSPQAGTALTPSSAITSPMSSPLRASSAPATPKGKNITPIKPKKTGSLALFFRKVNFSHCRCHIMGILTCF